MFKQKKDHYYRWRISYVRNNPIEFRKWLKRNNADIHAGLEQGEMFKFTLDGKTAVLFKTGLCNPYFNQVAIRFREESLKR